MLRNFGPDICTVHKLTKSGSTVNSLRVPRRAILLAAAPFVHADPLRAAASCSPDFRIALDIGHSLARPGVISAYGTTEFEYNRRLATAIDRRLRDQGVPVVLIGQDGRSIGLLERTALAATAAASVFLSLHHDSVQPHHLSTWTPAGRPQKFFDLFSGYSLFVSAHNPALPESLRFAGLLGDALRDAGQTPSLHHAQPIPGENRPLLDRKRGIYRFDELAVLRTARMAAVLLEAAIIVNRRDEELTRSPEGLERTVAAVTRAVLFYCIPRPPPHSAGSGEPAPPRSSSSAGRH